MGLKMHFKKTFLVTVIFLMALAPLANAETVFVKYIGNVNLESYQCA